MDWLLKIAQIIRGKSQIETTLHFHLDDDNWNGESPTQVLTQFNANKSIFNTIQKHPFVHLVISGESILQKSFNLKGEISEKVFRQTFPSFKPETTIVSASKATENKGIALFLPLFRYESICQELEKKSIKISTLSLCSSNQEVNQISYRNEPIQVVTEKVEAQLFAGFKNTLSKGAIVLILLFSIFFLTEKIQQHYLNDQLTEHKHIESQHIFLDSLNHHIGVHENIIQANSTQNIPNKYPKLNEIALTCPKEVELMQLQFAPLKTKVQTDRPIRFKENQIVINGWVGELQSLHDWTKTLKAKSWVKKVEIIEINNKPDHSQLEFKLDIFI